MDKKFIVYSNLSEIGQFDTLIEAKAHAVSESYKYDDVVTIEEQYKGKTHMAQYGTLYSLRRLAAVKTAR